MSHQTGITAEEELRKHFALAKDGEIRLIKIGIRDERLVLQHSTKVCGSWEDDYNSMVEKELLSTEACYLLFRLDTKNNQGYEWLYISYIPDEAPVRQKMLFAATSATLKREFGNGNIKEELLGTTPEEVLLEGYKKHLISKNAPAPLTMAEEELAYIKKTEVNADVGVDTKHQTMQGVVFPISQEALDKLMELKARALNYVQLSLDLNAERINLESFEDTTVDMLSKRIPTDHARYHFFLFKHTHEGDYKESIVFIYSMPGYKCSIKERMLYSSCKAPLVEGIAEQQLGMEIAKKIEIDDPTELTHDFLQDELHPKKNVAQQKFARPKGPQGRGPKRMTRIAKS